MLEYRLILERCVRYNIIPPKCLQVLCSIAARNASVNSKRALAPPGLTPGNLPFFSYGWQIPGGGDT